MIQLEWHEPLTQGINRSLRAILHLQLAIVFSILLAIVALSLPCAIAVSTSSSLMVNASANGCCSGSSRNILTRVFEHDGAILIT
jgi:hypothetical protein